MRVFIVTGSHIALLKAAFIDHNEECEWGGLHIDFKRPFGNSDMVSDAARIIGIQPFSTDDDVIAWPRGTRDKITKIYEGLATALECQLRTGWAGAGRYESTDYKSNWARVGD